VSTVRREIVLPVERERAWALLTEPAELQEWLADEVELEPEEGAPVRAVWTASGEERERRGRGAAARPARGRRDSVPLAAARDDDDGARPRRRARVRLSRTQPR
jgi:hypothetical protein